MASHPIDVLLREIARIGADPDGQDLINMTAAIVNVATDYGTVIGPVPPERSSDLWTLAICHRLALSLRVRQPRPERRDLTQIRRSLGAGALSVRLFRRPSARVPGSARWPLSRGSGSIVFARGRASSRTYSAFVGSARAGKYDKPSGQSRCAD